MISIPSSSCQSISLRPEISQLKMNIHQTTTLSIYCNTQCSRKHHSSSNSTQRNIRRRRRRRIIHHLHSTKLIREINPTLHLPTTISPRRSRITRILPTSRSNHRIPPFFQYAKVIPHSNPTNLIAFKMGGAGVACSRPTYRTYRGIIALDNAKVIIDVVATEMGTCGLGGTRVASVPIACGADGGVGSFEDAKTVADGFAMEFGADVGGCFCVACVAPAHGSNHRNTHLLQNTKHSCNIIPLHLIANSLQFLSITFLTPTYRTNHRNLFLWNDTPQ
mmetsp:Transcript_625/g.1134  ORF Transcript_625/g.1134 Transcript_625/m.1134 type:complete len:277 (+) Transcript_625:439-1269(+)